jgi:hypothetical protein
MGILALFAGKALNERVAFLGRYNIPEPVTGGLLFALVFTLAYFLLGTEVEFELTARDVLLVYFFTTIGLEDYTPGSPSLTDCYPGRFKRFLQRLQLALEVPPATDRPRMDPLPHLG